MFIGNSEENSESCFIHKTIQWWNQSGFLALTRFIINENHTDCNECGLKHVMKKMLSVPLLIKEQNVDKSDQKVGELTKEYIEANREILKQQKEELKRWYSQILFFTNKCW